MLIAIESRYKLITILFCCFVLLIDVSAQNVRKVKSKSAPLKYSTVEKSGDTLIVRLINKNVIMFINKEHGDEVYSFIGNLGSTPYFIFRYTYQFGEVEGFLLVNNRNGSQYDIPGKPVLSPDSKRIAVACVDLEARYNPNYLAVYRMDKDSCRTEYSIEPIDWGAEIIQWLDNHSIEYKKNIITEEGVKSESKSILQFKNGQWSEKQ
jgi:hypothetical protein